MRIINHDLFKLLERINAKAGHGEKPAYGTPGAYELEWAYGGVKLVQNCAGGGQRDISASGFGTKRELYVFMCGMVA